MTTTNLPISRKTSHFTIAPKLRESNHDEQSLLESIANNDRQAFWQLWLKHQKYLFNCCCKWMNGNSHDAEEILGQLMLKAWDKLPSYALTINNVRSWLSRMAYNLCVDVHRHKHKKNKTISYDSLDQYSETKYCDNSEHLLSPEKLILRQEILEYLREAIDRLPLRLKEPLILLYYHQVSVPEIAQRLMISQDSVYKRIAHARKLLEEKLNHYYHQEQTSPQTSDEQDSFTIPVANHNFSHNNQNPNPNPNPTQSVFIAPSSRKNSKSSIATFKSSGHEVSLFVNHNLATKEILMMCQESIADEHKWTNNLLQIEDQDRYFPSIEQNSLEIIDYQVTALCLD